jgi:alpha-L-glutamate ligase-like protein
MLGLLRRLHSRGVIGMNRRNIHYIGRYNNRRLYPLVDDKLRTKLLAKEHGIATPGLIGTIRSQFEVARIARLVADQKGFVIKPAKGSGGKGILVVEHQDASGYVKPSGRVIDRGALERHVSNILSGLHSLGGTPDVAVVEELVLFDERFSNYTYEGVPDIRVIVFRGYPVMAMMRLSTAASDGKANLHQGAVGVGIDIATGRAVGGVQFNRPVSRHPDTDSLLADLEVPQWEELLKLTAACYELTGLGYLGVDIVLDRRHGPLVLELNARPGLAIQIANGRGLREPLRLVERQPEGVPADARVAFALQHLAA